MSGKAIIILNPVEPPMIMRNTVFCAIPAEAAEPGELQDRITASIEVMAGTVREYVPGYVLRAAPQYDPARDIWNGMARVAVFLKVRSRRVRTDCDGGSAVMTDQTLTPEDAGQSASPAAATDLRITDSTLRDGSHAMRHQFTEEQVRAVVTALDGTVEQLRPAREVGASVARIATHCTEADTSLQHFGAARELGLETVGFLMLSHRTTPEKLAGQARIMVDAGARCGYVVDSAGALVLGDAQVRVQAVLGEIGRQAQVGFHGHQNLSMGVANSAPAFQVGARQIDGALCALGAGAGNAPTEVIAATFERLGVKTGVDVHGVLAAAENVVRPVIPRLPWMDRSSIIQGYAGVYSSFLLHAERAAQRYGVPAHEILQLVGEAGYIGGQEDMIIDIALQLAQERELGDLAAVGVR